jgi:hypothetical protein
MKRGLALYAALLFFSCIPWRMAGVAYFYCTGRDSLAALTASEEARQPLMLAFLGLCVLGTALFLRPAAGSGPGGGRLFAALALFFCYLSARFLIFQDEILVPGATLWRPGLFGGYLFLGAAFLLLLLRGTPPSGLSIFLGLLGWGLAQSLSFAFPLGAQSDMLPLIREAGQAFLSGHSPYSGAAPSTYWPGMWLSYLPFSALGLDLRWGNLLFMSLFAAFAHFFNRRKSPAAAAMLALFLLNPWLAYRHELYLSAYLWVLALFAFCLATGRRLAAALAFGLSLALYPFSWVLAPLWISWEWRGSGRREALKSLGFALGAAAVLLAPFLLWDAAGFFQGVLWRWVGNVEITHYNLIRWIPGWTLLPIQLLCTALGARWAWKASPSLAGLFAASAMALGAFFTANAHGSHYFFFIFAALLYFNAAAPHPWPSTPHSARK